MFEKDEVWQYKDGANKNKSSVISERCALTLANSHPLMSPPPSLIDLDSENLHLNQIFNYPDLLPTNEPLRRNNPATEEKKSSTTHIKTPFPTLDMMTYTKCSTSRKLYIVRKSSSDSDSELDISQYQATVTPSFQSVALVLNSTTRSSEVIKSLNQHNVLLSSDLLSDDVSSVDSMSNRSSDLDKENDLISANVSSSVFDTVFNASILNVLETPSADVPFNSLTQYSAADEAKDSRNWQEITLPDGRTRDIDMKVIEPYKRVLSHGGYLNAAGHNAIVVFSACYLPDTSRADYHYVMNNLFLYVVKTLEQLVTEDYVLIYLHGGSSRSNVPPFPWIKKCYQLLDRRLRKSLKNLFMLHPTFWLKSVIWMARPFISSKFWRKLIYVRTLDELYHLVPVEKAAVPEKVKKYDLKYT